ncbi:MAG TPA: DsbA family protein [Acidimicrobiales bacterium]|nr:DsbA family protein [Acidimicrobiales bacterium]
MHATVWSDYLCPWCYAGLDRTRRLEALGVEVTVRPFELHPDVPPAGWPMEGRGRRLYERVGAECEAAGLAFRRPSRLPNTRRALATSEWVRRNAAAAHPVLHRSLFAAVFVDASPIDDPGVLDSLVDAAGADADACRSAVESGEMDDVLDASREAAFDAGATGAPSWLLDGRLLIAGLQEPGVYERSVSRLRARP